jgi:Rps23 Pro-64 3,4-dihydroxylase Tpa1-like proline 4-hydroxylase
MEEKVLVTSTGEEIYIYDNVFPIYSVFNFQVFCERSMYQLNSESSHFVGEEKRSHFISATYTDEDLQKMQFFESEYFTPLFRHLENKKRIRTWVLLSTYLSKYNFHPDNTVKGGTTILYYVNSDWDREWGGETLFCNSAGELEIVVEFKPNRIVVFDSNIPHKPGLISRDAPPYRFTMTSLFI